MIDLLRSGNREPYNPNELSDLANRARMSFPAPPTPTPHRGCRKPGTATAATPKREHGPRARLSLKLSISGSDSERAEGSGVGGCADVYRMRFSRDARTSWPRTEKSACSAAASSGDMIRPVTERQRAATTEPARSRRDRSAGVDPTQSTMLAVRATPAPLSASAASGGAATSRRPVPFRRCQVRAATSE